MSWYGLKEAGDRAKRARHSARRRARELAAGPPITPEERARVLARTYCARCKLYVPPAHRTVDHATAIANGGTHDEKNLAMLCRSCNSGKGARTAPRKKGLRRGRWVPKRKTKFPGDVPPDIF